MSSSLNQHMSLTDVEGKPLPTATLLAGYAGILAELRERQVIRSGNAPVGDYAEWLVARALDGVIAPNKAAKSYDITVPGRGLIQVKARLASEPRTSGQLQTSPFRSWDFDAAALVLLSTIDYHVTKAVLLPVDVTRACAIWRPNVNGWVIRMTNALMGHTSAEDITDRLNAAATSA